MVPRGMGNRGGPRQTGDCALATAISSHGRRNHDAYRVLAGMAMSTAVALWCGTAILDVDRLYETCYAAWALAFVIAYGMDAIRCLHGRARLGDTPAR